MLIKVVSEVDSASSHAGSSAFDAALDADNISTCQHILCTACGV